MANKKTSDYDVLPSGVIADTYLFDIANPGVKNFKGTALELKNYIGTGQEGFDATVGAVGSGADYNDINTATAASKFNLLVIGDFTQPTDITAIANKLTITIAKKLRFNEKIFGSGAPGFTIIGGTIEPVLTNKRLFTSTVKAPLELQNVTILGAGITGLNGGLGNMFADSQHLIHNCKFVLPNTANSGFLQPSDASSFANLIVVGGGSSCNNFIRDVSDSIIDNIHFSGTFAASASVINAGSASTKPSTISNIVGDTVSAVIVTVDADSIQLSNISGTIDLQYNNAPNCNTSNCNINDFSMVGTSNNNYFSNIKVRGSTAISIITDSNLFVNCKFNPAVTLTAASNNNQLLLCKITGVYTDDGTDNAFITEISEDETLALDSDRLISTQKAIKTYADNIAKGITVDYYFSDTAEGVIPNYDLMYPADTGQAESTAAASIPAADTLIQTFITQTTEPNFTTLLAGIYDIHIHAAKTAGTKDAFIYAKFYKRTHPGGVETLLATSDNSDLLTGSNVGYTLHFSLLDDEILDATDRLVVKFYGSPSGVGTDPTATLYLEGANSSRVDIHTTTSSWLLNLQNIIYVNGAGNDSNAGKNMGTPKLTIASALTAASAQSPTATNIIVVKVLGGLRYAEDVTVPSWVVLDMSDAISNGQVTVGVTMGADSFYYFNEAIMPSGKESVRCTGAGIRHIKGNFTTPETSSTFLTATSGATVYLDVTSADAVKTGAKFYAISTGTHLYLNARRFAETVASTSDAASNVVAHIGERAGPGYTHNINHAGDFIFEGLASTGYVGFGGTTSATYPRTKCRHHSGTLAAAGSFVSIPATALSIGSTLQIVKASVWGWYPAASAWMPAGNIWGEGINFRIGSTGVQIQTPAASTGMAGQTFHLVYEYQQTNFLV